MSTENTVSEVLPPDFGQAWYERETVAAALSGDSEAGIEALRLCRNGLENNSLSPLLRTYLAERLSQIIDDVPLDNALCVRKERGRGRPADPFPEWKQQLGAVLWLLQRWGKLPSEADAAVCLLRQEVEGRLLDAADAGKIRRQFAPMERIETQDLLQLTGPYRESIAKFSP